MKRLVSVLAALVLFLGGLGLFTHPSAAADVVYRNETDTKLNTEFGQKLDLNNSDVRDFRDLRGFYPGLAGKIVTYSPFSKVEDVLNLPGISETQRQRLKDNLDKFTVTPPSDVFNEEANRYNIGVY